MTLRPRRCLSQISSFIFFHFIINWMAAFSFSLSVSPVLPLCVKFLVVIKTLTPAIFPMTRPLWSSVRLLTPSILLFARAIVVISAVVTSLILASLVGRHVGESHSVGAGGVSPMIFLIFNIIIHTVITVGFTLSHTMTGTLTAPTSRLLVSPWWFRTRRMKIKWFITRLKEKILQLGKFKVSFWMLNARVELNMPQIIQQQRDEIKMVSTNQHTTRIPTANSKQ